MSPQPQALTFADPKMALPFTKAFGTAEHKDLTIALLNTLLRLPADARIVDLEYLTPPQLPPRQDMRLSLVDVECTDARDIQYVVELQVLPIGGFEKRVLQGACQGYVEQPDENASYPRPNDIIALTICNFELFPQEVPMLSSWRQPAPTSRSSGKHSLAAPSRGGRGGGELQFVFLELPKYQAGDQPQRPVDQWAYFFRAAQLLDEIPPELSYGPVGEALKVVCKKNFSDSDWTAYERSKMAEEDHWGALTYARKQGAARGAAEGDAHGQAEGEAKGRRRTVLDLCEVLQIPVSVARRAALQKLDGSALDALIATIKQQRAWPSNKKPPARSARTPRPALR